MQVSLKKPSKVDLSKPALEKEVREYTPEHLTEEIFPNQSLKAYTPEHTCEEVIPERICAPEHICKEPVLSEEIFSEEKEVSERNYCEIPSLKASDMILLVVLIIALVAVVGVCAWGFTQEVGGSCSVIADDFFGLVIDLWSSFINDNAVQLLFALAAVIACVKALRRILRLGGG